MMSTQQIPATYEGILELFKKTDQRIDRRFQDVAEQMERMSLEADERRKEAAERQKKIDDQIAATEKLVDATNKAVGALTDKVGDMVEKLVGEGNLVDQFRELGHNIKSHSRHWKFGKRGTAESGEIDLFMVDGDIAILVEVKTTLKKDDVTDHIERIEKYRRFVDVDGGNGKRFVGAVAGTVIPENVINFAHGNGLYVIVQSARAVEIITQPQGFRAKEW